MTTTDTLAQALRDILDMKPNFTESFDHYQKRRMQIRERARQALAAYDREQIPNHPY